MARLPVPGQDEGVWGGILNEYLLHEHNPDGTHKTIPVSKGGTGADDPVDARTNLGAAAQSDLDAKYTLPTSGIPASDLEESLQSALTKADSALTQGDLDAHASDTTNVHGITDTANIETQSGAQSKADSAEGNAKSHSDSQLSAHTAENTGVHGVGASTVESVAGSQAKVDAHAADATTHGSGTAVSGHVLTADGSGGTGWQAVPEGVTDHSELDGLEEDDHTQYPLIVNTDSDPGRTFYVGATAPAGPLVAGDVWIDLS